MKVLGKLPVVLGFSLFVIVVCLAAGCAPGEDPRIPRISSGDPVNPSAVSPAVTLAQSQNAFDEARAQFEAAGVRFRYARLGEIAVERPSGPALAVSAWRLMYEPEMSTDTRVEWASASSSARPPVRPYQAMLSAIVSHGAEFSASALASLEYYARSVHALYQSHIRVGDLSREDRRALWGQDLSASQALDAALVLQFDASLEAIETCGYGIQRRARNGITSTTLTLSRPRACNEERRRESLQNYANLWDRYGAAFGDRERLVTYYESVAEAVTRTLRAFRQ